MSNPLIEALKVKLNVAIRYFAQILHIGIDSEAFKVPLLVCLSEHSVLFLDTLRLNLVGEVFYAQVVRVIEANNCSEEVIKFEFAENRPTGIPKKMTFISTDKGRFLKYLRCCWETDHLWRMSKVASLKLSKEPIDIRRYLKNNKKNIPLSIYPPDGSLKYTESNYSYFIDDLFSPTSLSTFSATHETQSYTLKFAVQSIFPIETQKDSLKSIAENLAEVNSQSGKIFIALSQPFIKKFNFVMDLAVWEGWEVGLVAEEFQVFVIVFRRKFIPPIMDSGQDLWVICKGGKYCRFFCENTGNSVFSLGISDEFYENLVRQKCDALVMNEEMMKFYQKQCEIFPDKVFYAFQVLISVYKLLDKALPQTVYKKKVELLKKNPLAQDPLNKSIQIKDPNKALDAFIRSCYLSSASPEYQIWRKKVIRYISYCVNGGLVDNQPTLNELLLQIMKINQVKETQKLQSFVTRLLHIHSSLKDEEFEDIYTAISKMLGAGGFSTASAKYSQSTNWAFNQPVLISFLETGFLKKELQTDPLLYPKLLIYLLQPRFYNPKLKVTVCKACSMLQDSEKFNTQVLIPHLIDLYTHKNSEIASVAAETLIIISQNSKNSKKLIYTHIDLIISQLSSKDAQIVTNTLALILSLSTDQSRNKRIFHKCKTQLLELVIGPKYGPKNLQIVSKSLQTLFNLIRDPSIAAPLTEDQQLLSECIEYIGKTEDLTKIVLEFFSVLCNKNQAAKEFIGRKGIVKMLEYLKETHALEIIKRVLALFRVLSPLKYDENYKILIKKNTQKVLDKLLQVPTVTIDQGLVQQINDFRGYLS